MKKNVLQKCLLVFCMGIIFCFRVQQANAQVDKAMKYAWFFDFEKAEKFLMNSKNETNDTLVIELAEALYAQGKYPQALYYYKLADKRAAIQSKKVQRNFAYACTMMNEKSPYFKKTNYFRPDNSLYSILDTFAGNSLNEDMAAFPWNNQLFVTTSALNQTNAKNFGYVYTKMPYLDVVPFSFKGSKMPMPGYFPKGINTATHDGPISISKDTNLLILTRNYSKANSRDIQNLYLSYYNRDSNRKWSKAQIVEFCKPSFSVQHPFYNESEKTLYFSSDMAGGFGGFDLYKTRFNGTGWTPPINLGEEINSEYDEVFPSFSPKGDLIYASNHIETTGGLDMIMYHDGNRYLLNEPFNSIYDDFGLHFNSKHDGYFSSNRFASKFDDNIYHFNLIDPPKQSLFVKVMDATTGQELDQVLVKVSKVDGLEPIDYFTKAGVTNLLIKDTVNPKLPLKFEVIKKGYQSLLSIDNEFANKDGKLTKEIYLTPKPLMANPDYILQSNNIKAGRYESILQNDTFNGQPVIADDITLSILSNPMDAFLRIDKSNGDVRIQSGASSGTYTIQYAITDKNNQLYTDTSILTVVVRKLLTEKDLMAELETEKIIDGAVAVNDTAYITINGGYVINIRTNDRVNGKKANFKNSVIRNEENQESSLTLNRNSGVLTAGKGIKPGTYHIGYDLIARGIKGSSSHALVTVVVRDFNQIPGRGNKNISKMQSEKTVVYFYNDEPRVFQIYRPAFNYQQSLNSYFSKIPDFYARSADSRISLDTFFTYHVQGGYRSLNESLKLILAKLNQGVQIEISVTAYCSPIASTEYNNKLSNRRLISVIRYVKKWKDGALSDAIESNRITFWEHSIGELEAPRDVSSDYNKQDESVFGIKASRERRVSVTVKIIGAN